jgi:hypothetical protein
VRAAEAATAIKSLNGSTVVLYYQQANGARPFYRMSSAITNPGMRMVPGKQSDCSVKPLSPEGGDGMIPHARNWDWYV